MGPSGGLARLEIVIPIRHPKNGGVRRKRVFGNLAFRTERIPRPLKHQHRKIDGGEMIRPGFFRFARRMKRIAQGHHGNEVAGAILFGGQVQRGDQRAAIVLLAKLCDPNEALEPR